MRINSLGHKFNINDNILFRRMANKAPATSDIIFQGLKKTGTLDDWDDRSPARPFHFLDIGCGSAELGLLLCQKLSNLVQVKALLIDPDPVATEIAREKFVGQQAGKTLRGAFDIAQCRFEDLFASEAFDLILCSHVHYYFEDWLAQSRRSLDMLAPNGSLCVVLKKQKGCRAFNLRDELVKILGIDWPKAPEFAEDLENLYTVAGIAFSKTRLQYCIDLPAENNTSLQPGSDILKILSFMFHIPAKHFIENEKALQASKEFVNECKKNERIQIMLEDTIFFTQKPGLPG